MSEPVDDEVLTAEGNLGQLTDEEWLRAHQALIASGDLPTEETTYVWAPGEPA